MNSSIKRSQFTIQQEIIALESVKSVINSEFYKAAVNILENRTGRIVITGLGKSAYIAQKLAASMTSLGHNAIFLHPTDAFHGDVGNVSNTDVLMALSFSGETKEVIKLAQYVKKHFHINVISITGREESALSLMSDISLNFNIKEEGCSIGVAPMASIVGMLALGDCLISAITVPKVSSQKEFARFHPGGSLGLRHTLISDVMKTGADMPIVNAGATFSEAVAHLNDYGYGVIGLVDKEGLVGILTDGDIRRAVMTKKNDVLNGSVMISASTKPITVESRVSLYDTLSVMESNKITSLFVKDEKIIGFVHLQSILSYLE
jgi:arabinose-5-phosphate isomerase